MSGGTPTAMALLDRAARRAPTGVVEATAKVLDAGTSPERALLAERGLRALADLLRDIDATTVADAEDAPSDLQALLRALQDANVLETVRKDDPLVAARLRGVEAKRQLLAAEGGVLPAQGIADLLGISRQAVDKRRLAGRLLAVTTARRGYAYPAWQVAQGEVLPGLELVLADLADHSPWSRLIFMLGGNTRLDGASPLEELRRGELESVRRAAQSYGEHGAA